MTVDIVSGYERVPSDKNKNNDKAAAGSQSTSAGYRRRTTRILDDVS